MLDHMPFAVLLGMYPLLIGTVMVIWPRMMTEMCRDEDNKPVPLTPANFRWTCIFGFCAVVLGVVLIVSGILGAAGAEDPVQF